MICQSCGIEAPTKYVAFYQNIGALILRFTRSVQGKLCKRCIHKHFWEMTGITLLLGWWGMISFVLTPFIILNNVVRYLMCIGLQPPAPDAAPPTLTDDAVERLQPYTQEIFDRLGEKEKLEDVAQDVALRADVTPGQVYRYVVAVIETTKKRQQGRARGARRRPQDDSDS